MINWDALGALGEWAGAIFTAIAVWVAISSSRLSFTPKVKVEITNGFLTYGPHISPPYLFCKAINVGISPVTIEAFSIKIPGTTKQMVFPEQTTGHLPARLERSESTLVSIEMQNLAGALLANSINGKTKLRISFGDSFGRKYFGKWTIDLAQFS